MTPTHETKACQYCGLPLTSPTMALKHLAECSKRPADHQKTIVDTPINPLRKGFSKAYRHKCRVTK